MGVERGNFLANEGYSSSQEIDKVREKMEFAERLHNFYDPENSLSELSERIGNDAYPIIYANHTQHINIAAFRGLYKRLPMRPHDFYIAIASSLDRGDQSEDLASFTNSLKPILEEEGAHFVSFARPKDISKYREQGDKEQVRQMISETQQNKNKIFESMKDDAGFMFFPETTTEGGAKEGKSKRKGLQKVDNKLFSELLEHSEQEHRELAFLPVGIVDANKIIEPRETDPTLRTKFQYAKSRLGLKPSQLAKVNIGSVFSSQDLKGEGVEWSDKDAVNDFMMRRVAELLPEEARGYYS